METMAHMAWRILDLPMSTCFFPQGAEPKRCRARGRGLAALATQRSVLGQLIKTRASVLEVPEKGLQCR